MFMQFIGISFVVAPLIALISIPFQNFDNK